MTTKIDWCKNPDDTPGEVWNPVTGCRKASAGCAHCYAERLAKRFWGDRKFTDIQCHWNLLDKPRGWKKPRMVFVNSMSDLFIEDVPDAFIDKVWETMVQCEAHTFIVLTKRARRMRTYVNRMTAALGIVPNNIWLGVSAENQQTADERLPDLLLAPAALHFVSCEPLLGSVDLMSGISASGELSYHRSARDAGLDWVIAGGESGPDARPMSPAWARDLRDQCQHANIPYFFKQWGEWAPATEDNVLSTNQPNRKDGNNFVSFLPSGITMAHVGRDKAGRMLDGREWTEIPQRS